ncbi:MAG: hypothetical protein HCAMLNBO_00001 [Candidatus Brocadia fulgida]|nr:hypothetical protein [Candidatus Brocadia fulgida]
MCNRCAPPFANAGQTSSNLHFHNYDAASHNTGWLIGWFKAMVLYRRIHLSLRCTFVILFRWIRFVLSILQYISVHIIAQQGRNQFSVVKAGRLLRKRPLAMTATMHFDDTLHVVIASEAKQSFTHKKRYLLKGVCEKTYKRKKLLHSNII